MSLHDQNCAKPSPRSRVDGSRTAAIECAVHESLPWTRTSELSSLVCMTAEAIPSPAPGSFPGSAGSEPQIPCPPASPARTLSAASLVKEVPCEH